MKYSIFTFAIAILFLSSCKSSNVKEPEYRDITNIRLIELGVLTSTAGVDLVYYNPNNFGVQLSDARGDVYVDNAYLGRFNLEQNVQVQKNAEFTVPAIIKVDMIGVARNQREIFKKKEALVRIEGFARVKRAGFSKEIPIKYERMQNIERFRTMVGNGGLGTR